VLPGEVDLRAAGQAQSAGLAGPGQGLQQGAGAQVASPDAHQHQVIGALAQRGGQLRQAGLALEAVGGQVHPAQEVGAGAGLVHEGLAGLQGGAGKGGSAGLVGEEGGLFAGAQAQGGDGHGRSRLRTRAG